MAVSGMVSSHSHPGTAEQTLHSTGTHKTGTFHKIGTRKAGTHLRRGNPRPMERLLVIHIVNKRVIWPEVMEGCCCCCVSEVYGLLF